jgi:murein DD-endopeptidase MepM/ murein hydrolase activator NlpD
VKSSADGVVVWVDKDTAANGGYGLYVRVRHQQLNIDTLYAHLSRQDVKVGQAVKFGQVIGLSGNTGNSTGPHLHYEVRLITDSGQPDLASAGETYRGRVDPMAWSAGLRAAA